MYRGATTLPDVVAELLDASWNDDEEVDVEVVEVVLVHDHGPDDSASVIRRLQADDDRVRAVWLSRNFGQHGATLAGMSSTTQEWIVTMDEDGQHDPAFLPAMIRTAVSSHSPVVYGAPSNAPTHGALRNAASRTAKRLIAWLTGSSVLLVMQSYRLVLGELGRAVAAYAQTTAYLDVALDWMTPRAETVAVVARADDQRPSGYSFRRLLSHFWRLVLTAGTRPLRTLSVLGALIAFGSAIAGIGFIAARLTGADYPAGFATLVVLILFSAGLGMLSLGVVAEYIGLLVTAALGKPAYLITGDTANGPLDRGFRTS